MRRSLVLVATLIVLSLGGTAAAGPNGFVGACNMVASWPGVGPAQGVGVQPGGGMEQAMFGTPAYDRFGYHNGDLGMDGAVAASAQGTTC